MYIYLCDTLAAALSMHASDYARPCLTYPLSPALLGGADGKWLSKKSEQIGPSSDELP